MSADYIPAENAQLTRIHSNIVDRISDECMRLQDASVKLYQDRIDQLLAARTPEDIGRVCHEVNRAYCLALGDMSQRPWADAPQWQRDSAIKGVEFHLANPDASPAASHDAWLAVKIADGWKYGPVKDAAKKEHPCFCTFSELPPSQQAKDFIFRAIVHALAG